MNEFDHPLEVGLAWLVFFVITFAIVMLARWVETRRVSNWPDLLKRVDGILPPDARRRV